MIQSSDLCCSCDIQLLMRPFYVFPCSHNFHVDCLIMELKPYLSEYNINRIRSLQVGLSSRRSLLNIWSTCWEFVNENCINDNTCLVTEISSLSDEKESNECDDNSEFESMFDEGETEKNNENWNGRKFHLIV